MLQFNPHVDDIYTLDKDELHRKGLLKSLPQLFELGAVMAGNRYDLMLDYSQRPEYGFWAKFFWRGPLDGMDHRSV